MTQMLGANDGIRGVDVQTASGTKKLNADKAGRIEVSDPKMVRALKAEGFTVAGSVAGFAVEGYPCACGHNSIFKQCGKCGTING